ncbi:MAG: MFS transporter [Thermoplasmata archaeon]|nr:MFS transporter [Thermoplasmata archaeon]MCI4359502.1 MFS transporter [Thermoplasmata archaeon]
MSASGPSGPGAFAPPVLKTMENFDRRYANRVMILLMGIVMAVLYIEGMLTPSLPTIQSDFHVDAAQVSLIISAYAVSGVALSPIIGKLGDIYGKRRVLSATMLAYAVAVSVTGFSPNFTFMVAARTIQGVGLTILPLGMSLMREEFPRELVPRAQGLLSAMFGVGFAVSLPLGSFVSQNYGWRFTYHSAIPFVLLLTVLVVALVRESEYRRPSTRVDYGGAALLGASLASLVTALAQGQIWGWTSVLTLGFAAVGLILLVPFLLFEFWWKRLGREPIIDRKLLGERNVAVTNAVLTVAGLGMYLALFVLIYQFEYPRASGGYNAAFPSINILNAGLDIIPLAVGMIVVAALASLVVSRTGVKPLALGGSVLTALGFYLVSQATSLSGALLDELVVGAGIALLNASVINLLVLTVDPKDMGQATAMNNVFRNLGGSVGAPIAGSLLASYTIQSGILAGSGLPSHYAFQLAFWIAAIVTLVGGLAVLLAQEVLGPARHAKFAHLPILGRGSRGGSSIGTPVPRPQVESVRSTESALPTGR